jgi:hypothetical protein
VLESVARLRPYSTVHRVVFQKKRTKDNRKVVLSASVRVFMNQCQLESSLGPHYGGEAAADGCS